jgi:hypothetical protein
MRQDRLEKQLLAALEESLMNPEMIEYTLTRFQKVLQRRLAEIQQQATGLQDLREQRRSLQAQAERVAEAVAQTGNSPTLLSKLSALEVRIASLDDQMETLKPMDLKTTLKEIRDFVYRNVMDLRGLLHQDASSSKIALSRHIGQLILKPKQTPAGPIYEVSGDVNLLAADVMPVVARDGIEPPTPAFSGLRSTS